METIARLAVLLSCAAAGGTLLVVLAGPRSAGPLVREAQPGSLPGVLPPALAGYVFLAAGVGLTRSPVESTPASSVCGRAARFALVSWLLAIGGVVVALVGGVRSEPDR